MKILSFIFILFFILHFSYSQSFKGGLTGGFVVSQVDGDSWGGYHKPGVSAGTFVYIMFNDDWGFRTELKYIQKGSYKAPNYEKGDNAYYKLRLSYIEMPLLARYVLNDAISFDGGMGISYLFKAMEDTDGNGLDLPDPEMHLAEIPMILGAHYALSEKLDFSLRFSYTFWFTPIRKHPGGQTYYFDQGQYNKLLNFSLAYTF